MNGMKLKTNMRNVAALFSYLKSSRLDSQHTELHVHKPTVGTLYKTDVQLKYYIHKLQLHRFTSGSQFWWTSLLAKTVNIMLRPHQNWQTITKHAIFTKHVQSSNKTLKDYKCKNKFTFT